MAVSLPAQTTSSAALHSGSPRVTPSPSKLTKAAHEFEAILLTSWLEKMNQSFVGSQESQDPAHDTVSSLGTQAIASTLTARGGIGIADMLLRQLQRAQPADANTAQLPEANEGGLALQQAVGSEKNPQKD